MDLAYDFVRDVVFVPVRYGLQWSFEGAHRIPPRGPMILASNHISYLDPFTLAFVADRRHRRVRYLAKAELFAKPGLGALLRGMGQIPVARASAAAADSLDSATDALGRGECVAVFPEGTISPDLEPMTGHSGTARLAAATGVPVFPVGLWGTHRILAKGRTPRWRTGVAQVAVVGAPIRIGADEAVESGTRRVMAAIAAAVARAREIYPQAPSGGEDPWWVREPASAFAHVTPGVGPA